MKDKSRELIENFETELAILKESGELRCYILAVFPPESDPLISVNGSSIDIFGLSEAAKQHHINLTSKNREE